VKYQPGQLVRVAARPQGGHHRTPGYLQGRRGTVERMHGSFANPETRAYGTAGLPKVPLYLVSFKQRELWAQYRGSAADRLYADIFEHWLEAAP
jgi:nitrile hydratase subunit beta